MQIFLWVHVFTSGVLFVIVVKVHSVGQLSNANDCPLERSWCAANNQPADPPPSALRTDIFILHPASLLLLEVDKHVTSYTEPSSIDSFQERKKTTLIFLLLTYYYFFLLITNRSKRVYIKLYFVYFRIINLEVYLSGMRYLMCMCIWFIAMFVYRKLVNLISI